MRLEEEARRLEHAEELRSLATTIASAVDGEDDSALRRLAAAQRALASIQRIDPSLVPLQKLFDDSFYALEELSRLLLEYERAIDVDPARLEEARRRRELLYRLMQKYGATAADVIESGRHARAELDLLDSAGLDLRSLETRAGAAAAQLRAAAGQLSATRRDAAARLGRTVTAMLPELGMPGGAFDVALPPREEIGPDGAEDVEFRVALNVGHDARALARVASGGELSRIMLALKTTLARLDRVPTLVFDEVDAGIGGRVGLNVGDTLRRVAEHHQVFAVTHLPQIAARAHNHILVAKSERGGITAADIAVVGGAARVEEIARMLGGDPESDVSRAHARELLAGQPES